MPSVIVANRRAGWMPLIDSIDEKIDVCRILIFAIEINESPSPGVVIHSIYLKNEGFKVSVVRREPPRWFKFNIVTNV
jgi:hypothetical protein